MAYGVEEQAFEQRPDPHCRQLERAPTMYRESAIGPASGRGAIRAMSVGLMGTLAIGLTDPGAASPPRAAFTDIDPQRSFQRSINSLHAMFTNFDPQWPIILDLSDIIYARPLVSAPQASAQIRGRVSGPAKAFLGLLDRWDLAAPEGARLLGESDPNLIGDLRSGVSGIETRDRTDRVRCVLVIFTTVNRLLRDVAAERGWIREARTELDGRSVIETMLLGGLEHLILAREFTEDFAGR